MGMKLYMRELLTLAGVSLLLVNGCSCSSSDSGPPPPPPLPDPTAYNVCTTQENGTTMDWVSVGLYVLMQMPINQQRFL